MAMTNEQLEWLKGLGAVGSAATTDENKRKTRATALEDMHKSLDKSRNKIREALQGIKVELQPETFTQTVKDFLGFKESQALLTSDSDAMNEIDSFSDFSRQKITPKDAALATNIIDPIMAEFNKLLETTDPEGNPIYSRDKPERLAKDFWEPLVREGIIPENFVPTQYSEVSRTFSAASDVYDSRLKKVSEDLTNTDKVLSFFDLPVAIGADILSIGSNATLMEGAITAYGAQVVDLAKDAPYQEVKKKADIVAGVAACLSSTKKAADAVFKKRDFQGAADAMIGALGKILTPTVGKELTASIVSIATAASHAVPIGDAVVRGDMAAVVKQMGAAIGDGLAASSKDPIYKTMGEIVKAQFEVMAKGIEAASDSTKAASLMLEAAVSAGATAAQLIGDKFKEKALEEVEKNPRLTKEQKKTQSTEIGNFYSGMASVEKFVGTKSGDVIKLPEAIKALTEKANKSFDKAVVDEIKLKAQKAQESELRKMLSTPDKELAQMFAFGFVQDEDDPEGKGITEEMRLKSLENLIAEVSRQQKIYDLAKTISTGGVAAVEKFVPGLSAASAATKLVFAFVEAIQKGEQMLVWFRNQKDAKVAVTVQYDAMMNRYGLATEQTIVAGVMALVAAVDLVGKAMQMAGHVAPVGVAISAGAAATENLIDISVKVTTEAKMRSAWSIYKKAIANPQDRKAAREALQTNPTLSKYAMAWGAVKDNNPIAQSALLSCGIDEQTLATPGANVDSVVRYLETYFRDDPKLLREVPVPEKWYPGPIELSAESWLSFLKAAFDSNPVVALSGKFDRKGSDTVTARLGKLDEAVENLAKTAPNDLKEKFTAADDAHTTAKALVGTLMRYKPVDTRGDPHPGVQTYVDAMTEKARIRTEALAKGLELAKTALDESDKVGA
jgi:hypothetical protein